MVTCQEHLCKDSCNTVVLNFVSAVTGAVGCNIRCAAWHQSCGVEMLIRSIVLLSGEIASGKSSVAKKLESECGVRRVSTGAFLTSAALQRNIPMGRGVLKELGDALDRETGGRWVCELAVSKVQVAPEVTDWLVDSIRRDFQIPWFKERFSNSLHVHITAKESTRRARYEHRRLSGSEYETSTTYEDAISGETEAHVRTLSGVCDLLIDTDEITTDHAATMVMARLHDLAVTPSGTIRS